MTTLSEVEAANVNWETDNRHLALPLSRLTDRAVARELALIGQE